MILAVLLVWLALCTSAALLFCAAAPGIARLRAMNRAEKAPGLRRIG